MNDVLGEGGFGKVFSGHLKKDPNQSFAIKFITVNPFEWISEENGQLKGEVPLEFRAH